MRTLSAIVMAVVTMLAAPALAQTDTTFTYQGELGKSGSPWSGTADFRIGLYTGATGGGILGSPLTRTNVPVTDGRFNVTLDYGTDFNLFNGIPKWLEIEVRAPAGSGSYVTLTPRQQVTRSPFSIQTRGIYVDDNHNVGIGTVVPEAPLHVQEGQAASGLVAQGSSSAVFERDGQNFVSILSPTTSERGILFGDADSIANGGIIFNSAATLGGFQFRTGGNVQQMYLTSEGRLGLGTSSPFGQLSIADQGAVFGIDAASSNSTLPTILANNTGTGPALWAQGNIDVKLTGGGIIVAGTETGPNVGIDANEVMARDNGATATLFLNADGGEVAMGQHRMHPALAYGHVNSNGTLRNGSPNIISVQHPFAGAYLITVEGGFSPNDIFLATKHSNSTLSIIRAGDDSFSGDGTVMEVFSSDLDGDGAETGFSFVVYRP